MVSVRVISISIDMVALRYHPHILVRIALLPAMLFSFFIATAQKHTDTLQEIKVKSKRRQQVSADERINIFSPGQKITTIDSITLQQYRFQSVANLLSQQVPVFVKSYGFNGLATLNFRGASAAQSQVYWNGIPLQNAALGLSDVSLLPVSLLNKVNIVYGGSAALWGSGNIGGALVVENAQPVFDTAIAVRHSGSFVAGSFGQYQLGLQSSVSTARWYVSANVNGQRAENNFAYTDNNDKENKTLNSKLQSGVAMVQAAYKANAKNTLSATAWYQNYYREIPKALFESISVRNQRDRATRLSATWNRDGERTKLYLRAAYIHDYMHYRDSFAQLEPENVTQQVYAEAGIKYRQNPHHQWMLFTPVHISLLERRAKNDVKYQYRYALAAAYRYTAFKEKLQVAANLRGEIINEQSILLPGINAAYNITSWLSVRGNVQRTYRNPTLNELYFDPGGNEQLKPEQGWSKDVGYTVKTNPANRLVFLHDLSYFDRKIHNWIIWFGGGIWTPHNIATVHSHGIETENNLQYRTGKWTWHIGLNTSYVLATTEKSNAPNDGSIGKQIPYTPRYNGQANIGFTCKTFHFNYNHTYTGYRFVTVDESQYLLPYNTGNIQLMYGKQLSAFRLQATAQCNNIWNRQYAVVNGRPMPGINWLVGLSVSR